MTHPLQIYFLDFTKRVKNSKKKSREGPTRFYIIDLKVSTLCCWICKMEQFIDIYSVFDKFASAQLTNKIFIFWLEEREKC